jgi:glutamate-1-semialdehyde 2,1-aminomutase
LQNIGVVKPKDGYLQGLRDLADKFGFILIFDEVKTGFRHALGGYASIVKVKPDLMVYGKALANGYPIAVLGGRREMMNMFIDPHPAKRVLLAGTYNGHPVPTAAAIATLERLKMNNGEIYQHTDSLGEAMQSGIESIVEKIGLTAVVAREGSAFCVYFMDHVPVDWHDLAGNHDFEFDSTFRKNLVERGIYVFPLATKQCSLSAAHSQADVDQTLRSIEESIMVSMEVKQADSSR